MAAALAWAVQRGRRPHRNAGLRRGSRFSVVFNRLQPTRSCRHALPRDRRGRLHRLQLRAPPARHRPRRAGDQLRQAHLRRDPGQRGRPGGRPSAPVRAGRHLRPRPGRRGHRRPRRRGQLRRRDPRRPLDRRAAGGGADQHRRGGHPGRGGPLRRGRALPPGRHRRGVRDHQRRLLRRGRPAGAVLAVLGRQGRRLPGRPGLRRHPQAGRGGDPLHQQLRALPVPREGHPAVRHQPDGRPQGAAVRQRRQHPRLAVRARPLQRHRPGAAARPDRRHLQHRRRQRGHQPGADPAHPGRLRRRRGHDRVRGRPAGPRLALLAGHQPGPRARLGPRPRLRPGPGRDHRLVPRPRVLVAPDEARRGHPDAGSRQGVRGAQA